MNRQAIIDRLTPKRRYQDDYPAPLCAMRGQFLFAATETNAGYFLLADEQGRLKPLTRETYFDLVAEARIRGVKLRNMRVFGAGGALKRAPGVHFYPIDQMQTA